MGALSSVMATAGAGLLSGAPADIGVAFTLPANVTASINTYNSIPAISQFQNVWSSANDLVVGNTMAQSTLTQLLVLGASTFPAVTDTIPPPTIPTDIIVNGIVTPWSNTTKYAVGDLVSNSGNVYVATAISQNQAPPNVTYWELNTPVYALTNVISLNANSIIDQNDLSKFCQAFMAAQGYVSQSNATLNSVKNSAILGETFSAANGGMDNLTTGGFNQVCSDLQLLSADLVKLGKLINFKYLDYLGFPSELLAQMGRVSGSILPSISSVMLDAGFTDAQIKAFATGKNDLDAQAQQKLYLLMQSITGTTLSQVLLILGVTTTGISTMADLLNPVKILPTCYSKLLCPSPAGLVKIYLTPQPPAVNTSLVSVVDNSEVEAYTGPNNVTSYNTLKSIIPSDQALANKALAQGFQQIKNIDKSSLVTLSKALAAVEPNTGLTKVNSLTQPVPASVGTFYKQQLGTGSGPDGTLLLTDVIGSITNPLFSQGLTNVTVTLNSINLSSLTSIYSYMANTIAGDYNDPEPATTITIPSGPAAGTYNNIDDAFTNGLTPAANTIINNIVANNSSSVTSTNTIWNNMVNAIKVEISNQSKAQIDFGQLQPNSTSSTMSFATNLHDYGVDISAGGPNQILTALANTNSLSGQCVISSLREGRNLVALNNAGISLDTQLSSK